ncbi:PEP-CTERM sorting domain-containing protein [Phycisphaerales bacterium AB-hyl4]|uniref:PEP-CTERM sorting domain-containing protein n=1 Tax=Natronomicrosphaera hydrolytica TaxID=3242702 RepID=A0ABV4UB43_9BACT
MKLATKTAFTAALLTFTVGTGASHAAYVSDFEAPTYTAGQTVIGQDGWAGWPNAVTTANRTQVTSDSARVLDGSQSVFLNSAGLTAPGAADRRVSVYRDISSAGVWGDGMTASVWMRKDDATAGSSINWALSPDPAVGASPVYVEFMDGNVQAFTYSGGAYTFPVLGSYITGNAYEVSAELDFTAQTYTVSMRNVTLGETELSELGTVAFASPGTLTPADFEDAGAFAIRAREGGEGVFDNVSIIPEPASMALLGAGSLLMLARRRRQMA